ncbi:MAG: DUF302 domain-containing protein [Thermoplasmata archaeon]
MSVTGSIEMRKAAYGIYRESDLPYEEAVGRTKDELNKEGFGVLTEIDVRQTLKEKLGVDFPRYVILGACNPPLAHRALTGEPDIGLLLPCNVVVHEGPDGRARVSALRPSVVFERLVENPALVSVAEDAEVRLTRALDAVSRAVPPIPRAIEREEK